MTAPTCPRHKTPLTLLEEGVLNGVTVRYWAGCPGTTTKVVQCQFHAAKDEHVPHHRCACRGGVHTPCHVETRTEDTDHQQPDLFHDQEATA